MGIIYNYIYIYIVFGWFLWVTNQQTWRGRPAFYDFKKVPPNSSTDPSQNSLVTPAISRSLHMVIRPRKRHFGLFKNGSTVLMAIYGNLWHMRKYLEDVVWGNLRIVVRDWTHGYSDFFQHVQQIDPTTSWKASFIVSSAGNDASRKMK